MKALRITGISLAVMLTLSGLVALWTLWTESGTRAMYSLAQRWLPPALTLGEVSGTIAGRLHLTNLHYRDPAVGVDLRIEVADIGLAPLGLLAGRMRIEDAQLDGVRLEFFPPTAPVATTAAPARDPWVAPIDMSIDELRLTRGEWHRADTPPILVNRAHFSGSWIGAGIEARALELESPDGQIALTARIAARVPRLERLHAKFRWRAGEHPWAGTLDAKGTQKTLDIAAALDTPVNLKLTGRIAPGHDRDTWFTQVTLSPFDPHPLVSTEDFNRAGLELEAEGNTQKLEVRGVMTLDDERIQIDRLALVRREQFLEITALRLGLNAQPARLTGNATLALDGSKPASAQLAWDEVTLPEAWAGAQFRCAGQVAMTVSASRYALNGSARLSRGDRQSTLAARVDGTSRSVHIDEFEFTQMPGDLSMTGQIELTTPARWQLTATAHQFDPSFLLDQWPGALDFDLRSTGEWPQSGPRARFELHRLAGRLRGRAISGSGDVTVGPDRKPSGTLQLQSGGASLHAVATRGVSPRVDATLKIAALDEWHQDLAGALHVEATAIGRWPDVELDARVSGERLHSGTARLQSAKLHLTARDARAPRGTLDLETRDVKLAGFNFERLAVNVDGGAHAHTVKIDAQGEPLSLVLQASGAYARESWSGTLAKLGVNVSQIPPLALAEPVQLTVARGAFDLGKACLRGGDIAVCAAARQSNHEITANYSVRALPLRLLAAIAAPGSIVSVDGMLEGEGDLRRTPGGVVTGRATLGSPSGAFVQGDGKDAQRFEYRDIGIHLELTPQAARAQLRGELLNQGDLGGSLSVAMAEADPPITGKASLKLRDLAPLGWWLPQLANLHGSGELLAEFGGSLRKPQIAFGVRGSSLEAEVPLLGVRLHEGSVDASMKSDGAFTAQGSIASGEGTLRLTGSRDADQGLAFKITGTQFMAANIPGARITVAPDLALAGRLGALELTGAVKIESADVNLEKLSIGRSYRPSSDVVIVDREVQIEDRAPGLATDVRILFGEQVKLAGYGLDATVSGELRVLEERNRPGRATGEIQLAGTYEAFGRKLTIERGRLQFAGTALDDPQLDILASRKIEEITAKLRVTGTAQNPKLEVFTDPAMSQTDAMSYLITGKSSSDLHGDEGAKVQSAAQSVGGVLGNRLAKKLGGKVGFIDEVGVEQNNDLGGSAFTVGKYLSPKLFVSYGVGLFEPGSSVTVRYEFTDHWSLEANDSPEDAHAGVRYRIEK